MKLYGIIGAGGFGREVIPLVQAQLLVKYLVKEEFKLVFIDDFLKDTPYINQYSVMTTAQFLQYEASEKFFNVAIASNVIRRELEEKFKKESIPSFEITALNHIRLDNNEIGEGAILCPFTTITSNAKIGKFFHANIYSYVAHDCIIGDFVTFAPKVHCNGNVIIEDDVYVGSGVIIREGTLKKPMIIGKGAILGMGAVVTKSVPPHQTVIGNPAALFKVNVEV